MESASFSLDGPQGHNDDRLLEPIVTDSGWIAAIADGVGGNAGGGRAAEIALGVIRRGLVEAWNRPFDAVFREACDEMSREVSAHPEWQRMATTASVVKAEQAKVSVAHVGDSRIYHIRGSGIVTRTIDQTEVAELVRQNVLTAVQAQRYPRKNVLISFLGAEAKFNLFTQDFNIISGDRILLVTDGVYNRIRKNKLVDLSLKRRSIGDFRDSVIDHLAASGLIDDSSMVAIQI